ncbi:MAG TPA: VOC family protein [Acidimicrobiales bacterium]|jgi:PhnB protein|nr:VOC family protein [Acidimicrobiales bacterium]
MAPVNPVPEHLRSVTPRLVVRNGAAAIEFYGKAFGAEELGERFTGPVGEVIHAEVRIGDSVVMITEESEPDAPAKSPESLGGVVSAIMALYWEDVGVAWDRAVAAGAEIMYPLADQFYGERGGRLRDPFGQQWMMSQHIEDVSHDEMNRRAAELFGS